MTAQSGLGFSGIVAIQIPDDGATGEVLTKISPDNYDYDWLVAGGGGPTVDPGTVDDSILRWNTVTPAWEEFATYIFPTVDGLEGEVMVTDGAGVLSFQPQGGGGLLSGQYRFSSSIVAADPGSGRFRYDTGAYGTVTQIFIDDETLPGVDISNILAAITTGDRLYIQAEDDSNEFAVWNVTAPSTDNVGWFTIDVALELGGDFLTNNDRVLFMLQIGGASSSANLQDAYDNATTPPQITINATPDPLTIDASVVGDVFAVRDTTNQDLLRLSTTGGSVVGGSNAGNILTLEGALAASADTGIVISNSPITIAYNTVDNTTPAEQFALRWNPIFATGAGAYVGGCLTVAPVITIETGTFIPATFSDTSNMLTAAAPGFSAFTFINELSVIENLGNFNLMSALVMNIGLVHERNTAGTSTTAGFTGISASPQTRALISGAVITKTAQTAVRFSPTFSTVAGSTANLGLLKGVDCFNPAVALFQPGSGTESMVGYIGLEVRAIPFSPGAIKVGFRSALVASTFTRFFQNISTAAAEFGSGVVHINDNTPIQFGGALNAADVSLFWSTGGFFEIFFFSTLDFLQWSSPSADRFLFDNNAGSTNGEYNFNCARFSLGAQTGSNGNQVGAFVTPARTIGLAGDWSDFLLTQAGSLTVGGLAMGRVSAWVINGVSYAGSTGTVNNADTLTVGGFPTSSPGVTITERQSLFVIAGRSRHAAVMSFDPINPTTLAAGNNNNWAGLLTGTANNGMRHWARVNGDAGGTSVITGIDATAAQDGDTFKITNVSAFTVTIGHQDVGSTATNRIISPTGANYVLGADESAEIIRDVTTDRWRILYGSGA